MRFQTVLVSGLIFSIFLISYASGVYGSNVSFSIVQTKMSNVSDLCFGPECQTLANPSSTNLAVFVVIALIFLCFAIDYASVQYCQNWFRNRSSSVSYSGTMATTMEIFAILDSNAKVSEEAEGKPLTKETSESPV